MGVLPTKGLTLPLMSYGRSSMIVTLAWVGLLLRVYHEAMQSSRGMATVRRSDGGRADGDLRPAAHRGGRRNVSAPLAVLIMAGGTGGHVFRRWRWRGCCARRRHEVVWWVRNAASKRAWCRPNRFPSSGCR
jgi:hypothetical protein